MTRTASCASRWKANKDSRVSDLRQLLAAGHQGDEDTHANDLGTLSEYGLAFDYVAPGTFNEQPEGYWRYQISWGGPSDEFRFYAGGCGEQQPYRISYAFLDWFDGHERALADKDLEVMRQLWVFFRDAGITTAEYRKTMQRTSDHD
jgi:hypothetical protein